jgi:serine/threonine protein kinase
VTQQLGKYQLIRKLATGGMAEVFLAKAGGPMGFQKTLVVKRILPHLAEDPTFVEMFLSEAKLAAQLNHPNIVQIFDFGEADDAYFLAMEYIDGPNLRVLLKRAKHQGLALPAALCARLVASACEGLAFAHDFTDPDTGEPLGLIHRDISPDNVLVSRQGAIKVVDFGIAKAAGQSHKTQSGVIKGKLSYMPPEQLQAKTPDRRVDVYALGVVLYELITGHKPFEATSDAQLMQAILFEPPVPAVKRRQNLPVAMQRILERALSRDREKRYPDCLSFSADLEEFILTLGKPVTAQQIVQLIAQVTPSFDAPVPTPKPGIPRSGPTLVPTPVPTPITIVGKPSSKAKVRGTASKAVPSEVGPPSTANRKKWNRAIVGAGLLVMGGGYLLFRPDTAPAPVKTAPASAFAETPPVPVPAALPTVAAAPETSSLPASPGSTTATNQAIPEEPMPPEDSGTTAPAERMGLVEFQIKPGGRIFLEDKLLGSTPLGSVQMPAGTYNFTVTNKRLAKKVRMRVEIKADAVTYVRLDLLPDKGSSPQIEGAEERVPDE